MEYNSKEWVRLYRLLKDEPLHAATGSSGLYRLLKEPLQAATGSDRLYEPVRGNSNQLENSRLADFVLSLQSLPQTYVDSLKVYYQNSYDPIFNIIHF